MENIDFIMDAELLFESHPDNIKGIDFHSAYQIEGVTENVTRLAKEFIKDIKG